MHILLIIHALASQFCMNTVELRLQNGQINIITLVAVSSRSCTQNLSMNIDRPLLHFLTAVCGKPLHRMTIVHRPLRNYKLHPQSVRCSESNARSLTKHNSSIDTPYTANVIVKDCSRKPAKNEITCSFL